MKAKKVKNLDDVAIVKRKKNRGKGNVDGEFLSRIIKLIKIVIPNMSDPVIIDFVMLNISLVLRTILSNVDYGLYS